MNIKIPGSFGSLEEANEYLRKEMHRQNNEGRVEFEGYSPIEMHQLLHFPFGLQSPLTAGSLTDELTQEIWIYQIALKILEAAAKAGGIKLTAQGNLPVSLIKEIVLTGKVKEEGVMAGWQKIYKESDSEWITVAHHLLKILRALKKRQNFLTLTTEGKVLLIKPDALFIKMLETCMLRINWGAFDRYESGNIGQLGAGFTLLLLIKYGKEQRPASFYADKYLKAFPMLEQEGNARQCYISRTFSRFLLSFGLVETTSRTVFDRDPAILGSRVLHSFFTVRPHRITG